MEYSVLVNLTEVLPKHYPMSYLWSLAVIGESRVRNTTTMEDQVLGKKDSYVSFAAKLFSSYPTHVLV